MKNKVIDSKYAFVSIVIALGIISLVTISLASSRIDDSKENNYTIKIHSGESPDENVASMQTDNNASEIELVLPLEGERKISARFGKRIHPITKQEIFHSGVDIVAETGEAVAAVAKGKVIFSGFDTNYGNYIKISHENGTVSLYAHGSKLLVKTGDEINAGEKIMLVGSTGMATGSHLHFEMQDKDGEYIDVNQLFE